MIGYSCQLLIDDESIDEEVKEDETINLSEREKAVLPILGEVIDLESVKDSVFSSGAMGEGLAIIPKDGHVYVPFDGEVTMLFKTKHAIGLTSDKGNEILIHIGMDTVELDGEYFKTYIKQGDRIKQGELLIDFDIDSIINKGYDITTPIVVTNNNIENIKFVPNDNNQSLTSVDKF